MPNIRSAAKAMRSSAKKQMRNKSIKSALKTATKKVQKLTVPAQVEAAGGAMPGVVSALDKAAQKGIIHRNTAARKKSRLMKKLNTVRATAAAQASAPQAEEAKPKKRTTRKAAPKA